MNEGKIAINRPAGLRPSRATQGTGAASSPKGGAVRARLSARAPLLAATAAAVASLALAGCPCSDPAETEGPGAGETEDSSPTITVPYDGRLRLVTLRSELEGESTPLSGSGIMELSEGASIYLETWQRLDDHRVRLVDRNDRLIPFELESGPVSARSGPEAEPGGTWLRLRPNVGLEEGRTYYLRIEPELAERVTDYKGRDYDDLVLELRLLPDPEEDDDEEMSTGEYEAGEAP